MVAYSFRPQFVEAIKRGLEPGPLTPRMKRQTMRAVGRKRHADPGDELQLYQGQRTKQCRLLGAARCVRIRDVILRFDSHVGDSVSVFNDYDTDEMVYGLLLDAFARRDGFADWAELRGFWLREHGLPPRWAGYLIEWEPIPSREETRR